MCDDIIPESTNFFTHICQKCEISVDVTTLFSTALDDFHSFPRTSIDVIRTARRRHKKTVPVD